MKKIIKILIVIVVPILFLTGCNLKWSDVVDAVGQESINKGAECAYYAVGEKYNDIEKITFSIDPNGVYINFNNTDPYFMAGPNSSAWYPSSYNNTYAYNNINYKLNDFGDVYFEEYKSNKGCPRTVYINGSNNAFSMSKKHPSPGDPIKDYAYTLKTVEIQNSDGTTSSCRNQNATICDNVTYDEDTVLGTVHFEWGYANGQKYFWISRDSGFSSYVAMSKIVTNSLQAVENNWFYYEISKAAIDDIWVNSNTIISKNDIDFYRDPNTEFVQVYIFSKNNPIGATKGNSDGKPLTIDGEPLSGNGSGHVSITIPDHSCTSLLGDPSVGMPDPSPAYLLTYAFKIIRYIALIILVVLSTMDFISSVSSQDKDSINKAINKTIQRAIICVIVFLLPSIIEFVLTFLNDRAVNICINY